MRPLTGCCLRRAFCYLSTCFAPKHTEGILPKGVYGLEKSSCFNYSYRRSRNLHSQQSKLFRWDGSTCQMRIQPLHEPIVILVLIEANRLSLFLSFGRFVQYHIRDVLYLRLEDDIFHELVPPEDNAVSHLISRHKRTSFLELFVEILAARAAASQNGVKHHVPFLRVLA